jgi:predicted Zn finger-like uncharacterized protein
MNIICPYCGFSKIVDPAKIPDRPVKVNCPKCSEGFVFDKTKSPDDTAEVIAEVAPEQETCQACGLVQDKSDSCSGCGIIYAKFQARQQETGKTAQDADTLNDNLAALRRSAMASTNGEQPKAGFWIRVVATMIDSFLLLVVQFSLSFLIGLVINMMGFVSEENPAVSIVIGLFGLSITYCYAVFFIGYCGQTPGKMALRIKVIRADGRPISYGRAALREVPGKFISGILLGIGYLMVAFDSQKQGLHDKMADTYVIKL